jgi:hypothetical protein
MRRAHRQKTTGAEKDWIIKKWRRLFDLSSRRGRGKYAKRAMARRRRHAQNDRDK